MGRMCTYTPEIAAEICEKISSGESLRSICKGSGMPPEATVRNWAMDDVNGFAAQYARAREIGADAIAEQALYIADTPEIGEEVEESENGMKVKRADMLGHRKLQVETRLKLLAKWFPKKYGDKAALELTGADGGPVQITDTERAAKIAAILAAAKARRDMESDDVADLL